MAWCATQDTTKAGYVYVIQSAWSAGTYTPGSATKATIKTDYDLGGGGTFDVQTTAPVAAIAQPNSLSGYQTFSNFTLALFSSAIRATALRDWGNDTYLAAIGTDRLDTFNNNSVGELEAALSKSFIELPFVETDVQSTVHIIGFPTKLTNSATITNCTVSSFTFDGPFFDTNITGSDATLDVAGVTTFDLTEDYYAVSTPFSPAPPAAGDLLLRDEMNLILAATWNPKLFTEGWIHYPFDYLAIETDTLVASDAVNDRIRYDGVPALTASVIFGAANAVAASGSSSDAVVYYGVGAAPVAWTLEPFYQYAE